MELIDAMHTFLCGSCHFCFTLSAFIRSAYAENAAGKCLLPAIACLSSAFHIITFHCHVFW